MGVQKDAGELLLFFYDQMINKGKKTMGPQEVINETKWKSNRINNAYNYLNDMGILNQIMSFGNTNGVLNFVVLRIYPPGINIIENQPEFKRNFGFEINLGLVKFSWGTSER